MIFQIPDVSYASCDNAAPSECLATNAQTGPAEQTPMEKSRNAETGFSEETGKIEESHLATGGQEKRVSGRDEERFEEFQETLRFNQERLTRG